MLAAWGLMNPSSATEAGEDILNHGIDPNASLCSLERVDGMEGDGRTGGRARLLLMQTNVSHNKGVASPEVAGHQSKAARAVIKLGVDVHARQYVVVAQHGHAAPKPPQRFTPDTFVPWVEGLLRAGHAVHAVYEACGFGFGLQRALAAAGAACVVIAPRKLDEARSGVKTDARDAATLCQRLGRYLDGNQQELAVIRVPSEQEERERHVHRQREALVRARTKLQAQGRALLVTHALPAPAHWWRPQTWGRFTRLLPAWLVARLEVFRPVLTVLDTQIAALSQELEAAAPKDLPTGLGKLTSVSLAREVCDWRRFANRRQVASYTGLCPGEHSSGDKRVQGHVTKHGNPRLRAALVELAWRLVRFQPAYPPVAKRLAILAKGARATGAQRKKAIVAVARHLAIDLWRLHTGQCGAQQLGFVG
jgi:transposase